MTLLDTPIPPSYSFNRDRSKVLKMRQRPPYPPLAEFMRDEVKLAGIRVDPLIRGRSRMSHTLSLSLLDFDPAGASGMLTDLPEAALSGIPEGMVFNYVRWSPSGTRFAFTLRSAGGEGDPARGPLDLWLADTSDMCARRALPAGSAALNTIFEDYVWVDDNTLAAVVIPADQAPKPEAPLVPVSPKISDNSAGRTSKARTYPDLLQSPYDEDLFEWLTTGQLVVIDVSAPRQPGRVVARSAPGMYTEVDVSPDASLLLVSWIERPFSYELPVGRFPRVWQVWDRALKVVHEVCRLPLQDSIPIEFDATRCGPRRIGWRSNASATLTWVEAQDGGDPKKNPDTDPRDIGFCMDLSDPAAAGGPPRKVAETSMRWGGIAVMDDSLGMLYESEWQHRRSRVWIVNPSDPDAPKTVLFDRNWEDIYTDPGSPMYVRHPSFPRSILARVNGGDALLMQGEGACKEGNRPFLDVLDLTTRVARRIWQSREPHYESPLGVLMNENDQGTVDLDDAAMLITRETPKDPPQYHMLRFSEGGSKVTERQLTDEPHPFPQLRDLQREILEYERADGVKLNGELFTPPGYIPGRDGPLATVLWAYPREFKSRDAAGQLDKSPFEFSGISASSPLVWLAKGYAVLSGPSMPIVAEGDEEPNDTYVEQLIASARAAVDTLVSRGVTDPSRVAIGGHSYGAFMTANILAHAGEMFACGIAQSGAYNRTLTPFGFQSEQRTFWDAPEVYALMAPFNQAHRIKKPLLLIHGEADNNSGTFPLQSERMYAALQGNGCPCRLVLLPLESHGYRAWESVMHVLAENEAWLDRWCPAQVPTCSEV